MRKSTDGVIVESMKEGREVGLLVGVGNNVVLGCWLWRGRDGGGISTRGDGR